MTANRAAHRSLLTALRNRPLVVVESPFRGDTVRGLEQNLRYAHAAVADSLARGEAPFAPHLFYPSFLDDNHEASRRLGLMCGWTILVRADTVAVYLDLGLSEGMQEGIALARSLKIKVEERLVPGWNRSVPAAEPTDYMRQLVEEEPQ